MHLRAPRWLLIGTSLMGVCTPCLPLMGSAPEETEILAGMLISPIWASSLRLTFNYAGVFVRDTWPLTLAGREYPGWDWVGEVFAADVVDGFGHELAGPSLLARRSFGSRSRPWRLYVQGGFGVLYSDAYRDPRQQQLGEAVEFKSSVDVGIQLRPWRRWCLAGELMFNHISDASLSPRNKGVSALGLGAGLVRRW
jgi:hypothetical protein